jgi:hypothetical protein
MKELPFGVLFYSVNGGRMLPLQNVIPRCQKWQTLVGIGREMNQAGYLNDPPVSCQSLQGFAIFGSLS